MHSSEEASVYHQNVINVLVSISSMFYVQIFRTNIVSAAFSSYMYIVKAAETTFVQNIRT